MQARISAARSDALLVASPEASMADDRTRRPSDLPGDLVREREAFVRSFLKKGFELTEELLVENTGLRGEIARVRDENARLRAAVASSEAIRDLPVRKVYPGLREARVRPEQPMPARSRRAPSRTPFCPRTWRSKMARTALVEPIPSPTAPTASSASSRVTGPAW